MITGNFSGLYSFCSTLSEIFKNNCVCWACAVAKQVSEYCESHTTACQNTYHATSRYQSGERTSWSWKSGLGPSSSTKNPNNSAIRISPLPGKRAVTVPPREGTGYPWCKNWHAFPQLPESNKLIRPLTCRKVGKMLSCKLVQENCSYHRSSR